MSHAPTSPNISFLRDEASQMRCLEDACRCGGPAMIHALQAVIQVRGLEQLAADGGATPDQIETWIHHARADDLAGLIAFIERLIELAPSRHAVVTKTKMIRNDPQDAKTRPSTRK